MPGNTWKLVEEEKEYNGFGSRANHFSSITHVMDVPGGKLYRTVVRTPKAPSVYGYEVAMCFVPY